MTKRKWQLLSLLGLVLVLAACGSVRKNWAGISPVSETGEIVVAYDRFIAKLSPNGERIWAYPPQDKRRANFYGNPTITEDRVYAGDYTGNVHAINRETGEEIWVYEQSGTSVGFLNFGGSTDRVIGRMTVGDGILYVPDEEGVFALDLETGERRSDWIFATERAIWADPLLLSPTDDLPARLIVAGLDHHLYALDAATGETLWKTDLGGAAPSMPTYDAENDLFFVGTFASDVLAITATTGDIVATYGTKDWVWQSPVLFDGNLYFSDLKGNLYAARFADGDFNILWQKQIASREGRFRAAPLVTDELLVIGSDNKKLYAVNRQSGDIEWETDTGLEVLGDLLQVQGEEDQLVVVTTNKADELAMGFRLETGDKRWTYEHKD